MTDKKFFLERTANMPRENVKWAIWSKSPSDEIDWEKDLVCNGVGLDEGNMVFIALNNHDKLVAALNRIIKIYETNHRKQTEKLADIPGIARNALASAKDGAK